MRTKQVVAICLFALLLGTGCGRHSGDKAVEEPRTSPAASPTGKVYRSDRVPKSLEVFGEVQHPEFITVYPSGHLPHSVQDVSGTVEVLNRAPDEKAIAAWQKKSLPYTESYFRGTVRDDPSQSFIVAAYRPHSGAASWNAHLFTGRGGKDWQGKALIVGLLFKDSRTKISSANMPDANTLILKDQHGNHLVRFRL